LFALILRAAGGARQAQSMQIPAAVKSWSQRIARLDGKAGARAAVIASASGLDI